MPTARLSEQDELALAHPHPNSTAVSDSPLSETPTRHDSGSSDLNQQQGGLAPPQHDVQYLTDDEIKSFLDDLDHNDDGNIDYTEVEANLDAAYKELINKPSTHQLNLNPQEDERRHAFLRSIIGSNAKRIPRDEFAQRVKEWNIPSMKQDKEEEEAEKAYMRSLPKWRRFRSWWSVHGPQVVFIVFVICFELAFGIWQCVKYVTQTQYRAALGWGVVMAKTNAGFLYPTMFLLLLSMCRYFSTLFRRSYYVSRVINWDLSQSFHIWMSCLAIIFATLHAIGHLSGSFVFGSRDNRQPAVANLLGPDAVPRPYGDWIGSLPGVTGLIALSLFYILALLSMPQVRKWNYEVFQLGHLLMYPIIGCLMAHGTKGYLQFPMMGYFLAFPTLLILVERLTRFTLGFRKIPAKLYLLDSDTIEIRVSIPKTRIWKYQAGQYIFLQVPAVSFWQWHPFTVSECRDRDMKVHIKMEGAWTKGVRDLANGEKVTEIHVGVNGPFGAPAERFYDFTHTILVGSGIGVTPFSGILADLQAKDDDSHGGPEAHHHGEKGEGRGRRYSKGAPLARSPSQRTLRSVRSAKQPRSGSLSRVASRVLSRSSSRNGPITSGYGDDYRRVDFHWTVRDRNHLLWFSDLLNKVSNSQIWHKRHDDLPHLDVRIQTHVTAKRNNISHHIYRWLLEMHRTEEHPESPLTGLVNPTRFGRPDFVKILDKHYDDMVEYLNYTHVEREKLRVGVFYCGAPVVGEILADRCRLLSARGSSDGTGIEYMFMTEVFG
jgi:predicted ferric reductase